MKPYAWLILYQWKCWKHVIMMSKKLNSHLYPAVYIKHWFWSMRLPLSMTSSSSIGDFAQQYAFTATEKEEVCCSYGIMISKILFFHICENYEWFWQMVWPLLAVLWSSFRTRLQYLVMQYVGIIAFFEKLSISPFPVMPLRSLYLAYLRSYSRWNLQGWPLLRSS